MAVCEVPLISPLTEGIDELVSSILSAFYSDRHRPFPHQALNRADRAVPSERCSDDSTVETDIEVLTFHVEPPSFSNRDLTSFVSIYTKH